MIVIATSWPTNVVAFCNMGSSFKHQKSRPPDLRGEYNVSALMLSRNGLCAVAQRGFGVIGSDHVGQVGNLRPIVNRPVDNSEFMNRPISNRPQDAILPHKTQVRNKSPHPRGAQTNKTLVVQAFLPVRILKRNLSRLPASTLQALS